MPGTLNLLTPLISLDASLCGIWSGREMEGLGQKEILGREPRIGKIMKGRAQEWSGPQETTNNLI